MTEETSGGWQGWRAAAEAALYGPGGFYRRPEGPAGHFRTSVHASPLFAEAVARLLCRVDEALDRPGALAFVDMAAGRGELVGGVLAALPAEVAARTRAYAVEIADRPAGLDDRIEWLIEPPQQVTGLLFANEWLDNVPVDAAIVTDQGWRLLLVDPATGDELPGDQVAGADLEWLERWWPAGDVGDRAEIGRPRDEAWAAVIWALSRGVAVAVDYHHPRTDRPRAGSLAGYRSGRLVAPVPDGTCDITSHVALDSCAAAGEAAGAEWTVLTDQRAMLQTLLGATAPPPYDLAIREPASYLAALSRASHAADLTRRDGLGGFGWLVQGVGVPKPVPLP